MAGYCAVCRRPVHGGRVKFGTRVAEKSGYTLVRLENSLNLRRGGKAWEGHYGLFWTNLGTRRESRDYSSATRFGTDSLDIGELGLRDESSPTKFHDFIEHPPREYFLTSLPLRVSTETSETAKN